MTMSTARSRFQVAGKTDPGCVRANNEDSLGIDENIGLLIVADGMGGHNSGEVASNLATETILDFARKMLGGPKRLLPEGTDVSASVPARQLEYFIKTANTIIFEKARNFPQDHGMGTTVVAALLEERSITVAHVGDSRCYVFRNGMLQVMTQDHSLVMDQVRRGLITSEQAETSALQNVLIRALGTEEQVTVDVQDHPVLPGDVFLLCTDGLTKMIPEAKIAGILKEGGAAHEMADRLIEAARAAGGIDNITVVIARIPAPGEGGVKKFLSRLFHKT